MSFDDMIAREEARARNPSDPNPGDQGSIEWLMERCGHVTASRFKDVLDFTKAGKAGAKRQMYLKEIICERLTGKPIQHYVSTPMLTGIEREPLAKMAYESRTNVMLLETGFVKHKTLAFVGGSPDALIGDDGGLEIKCPTPTTHIQTWLTGMDDDHYGQVQGLMWLFDRQWWDFVSYCPDFSEPLRTYIQRVPRDDAYIATLESEIIKFLAEVAAQVDAIGAKVAR